MHMLIYALVEASTEDEALSEARGVFDQLVGATRQACPVFDYYVTFAEDDTTVAGKARWGELPVAAPVASEAGQDLVEQGWQATREEFERNLDRVREGVAAHDVEALMRDEDLVRHACQQLGAYRGPSISLYDQHGDGIRDPDHLERVLERSGDLWVVPADVHF